MLTVPTMERQDAVWLLDQAEMVEDIEEDQVAHVDESEAHEVEGEEEGHDEVGGAIDQVDPLSFLGEATCCRPGGPGGRNS